MSLERKEDVKNTMINEIVKFMTTPAYVLDNVFPTIMSEQNFDRLSEKLDAAELLADDFLDLKVLYRVCNMCNGSIISYHLKKEHLSRLNLSEADVKKQAKKNAQRNAIIQPIVSTINELVSEVGNDVIADIPNQGLWVVGESLSNSAAIMIYEDLVSELLMSVKEDTSFYILPSSVHELIVAPALDEYSEDELREMVMAVNAEFVSDKDKLSDELYFWDCKTKKISICC